MGTAFDRPRHVNNVRHLHPVFDPPEVPLYDHEVDELTPEVYQFALSSLIGHARHADDPRLREAARIVEACARRATRDDCNPRGIPRPVTS